MNFMVGAWYEIRILFMFLFEVENNRSKVNFISTQLIHEFNNNKKWWIADKMLPSISRFADNHRAFWLQFHHRVKIVSRCYKHFHFLMSGAWSLKLVMFSVGKTEQIATNSIKLSALAPIQHYIYSISVTAL